MITPLLTLMVTSIKKTSHSIIRDFNELEYLRNNPKGALSFANQSNLKCKEALFKDLSRFKNTYSFIFEEGETRESKDRSNYFYLNGIVGLNNFVRAIPHFAIALYLKRDSKAFASVLYNPITSELFTAEQGSGAFYNQRRLKIQNIPDETNQILATDHESFTKMNLNAWQDIRISSNLNFDLCYIAAQKFSAGAFHNPLNADTIAGSMLMVKEAGAKLSMSLDENNNINSLLINCG